MKGTNISERSTHLEKRDKIQIIAQNLITFIVLGRIGRTGLLHLTQTNYPQL